MPFRLINSEVDRAAAEVAQRLQQDKATTATPSVIADLRQQLKTAQTTLNTNQQFLITVDRSIQQTQSDLAQARTAGQLQRITELEQQLQQRLRYRDRNLTAFIAPAAQQVFDRHKELVNQLGTAAAYGHLTAQTPIALLPVRLETRYFEADATTFELRVRIFPDVIHIDDHQPWLSPSEYAIGQQYWQVRRSNGPDSEATLMAWQNLVEQFGAGRATWIVGRLDPFGLGGRHDPAAKPIPVPKLETLVAPEGWLDLARAKWLPDRWAIAGYRGNKRVLLHWTSPIPPDLQVSPDVATPGKDLTASDPLAIDTGIRWLTNFATAESVGMAARIRVHKTIARSLERLVVFGIRASQTAVDSSADLETLFQSHQSDGLDFVLPGSPTNNTPQGKTEFRPQKTDYRQSHQRLITHPPTANADAHATRLARSLGINSAVFRDANYAQSQEENAIKNLFRALWFATLGNALTNAELAFPHAINHFLPTHFIHYVRPRGYLPTLRLQSQPYGVLPVLSLERWKSTNPLPRETILVNLLRSLRPVWLNAPRPEPLFESRDPQSSLIYLLSQAPTSTIQEGEFWQYFTADAANRAQTRMTNWWNAAIAALQNGVIDIYSRWGGEPIYYRTIGAGATKFSINRPLVAAQADKTQPLVKNYLAEFGTSPPFDRVQNHEIVGADERPILYLLLRTAYLRYLQIIRTSFVLTNPPFPLPAEIASLQDLPVATLEALTTDVIDAMSYRLDAWISSIANGRLDDIRSKNISGIHIGGYGWVEGLEPPGVPIRDNLPPQLDPDSAGYLHQPTLSQAKTAAILHGGYLAHVEQASQETLTIDLSSDRVRLAKGLLAGMSQGQSLGALLGYRFERYLITHNLGQYISEIRFFAPMQVSQFGASGAMQVVDGLLLHQMWKQSAAHLIDHIGEQGYAQVQPALMALDDAQDALSDLLLAEGVHQATNGNPIRAAAAFDAMADGSSRVDEPDVVTTAVSGQQVGHRVAVILPAVPPAAWAGDAQRLRAIADPHLNAWAAALLGSPQQIRFRATFTPENGGQPFERDYALAEFNLCALDVVYLAAANPTEAPLIQILHDFLKMQELGLTGNVAIATHRYAQQPAETDSLDETLAIAYECLRVLRQSRPLQPTDFLPEIHSSNANLSDFALADLATRVQTLLLAFTQVEANLTTQPNPVDHRFVAHLIVGAAHSSGEAGGEESLSSPIAVLNQRQADYAALTPENSPVPLPIAQIKALLGKDFVAIAPIQPSNAAELNATFAEQTTLLEGDLTRPKRWLQDYARVRSGAEAIDLLLTLNDLFHRPTSLKVGQLPLTPGQIWIGDRLTTQGTTPRLSILAYLPFALTSHQTLTGLLVDTWSETIPSPTALTGLSFHYDAPKAQAPQVMLLALPPDLNRPWEFEDLESTLLETFDLIKIRNASPAAANSLGNYLPALWEVSDLRPDINPVSPLISR